MQYLAENLKKLRKSADLTQEDIAEALGVTSQSVSKWERGDATPDITALPALANLFKVSVDALIGIDKINENNARANVFSAGRDYLRNGDYAAAAEVYSEALKTFPNDDGIMLELASTLAIIGSPEKLSQAVNLCERVLSGGQDEQVHNTARAAICFIYYLAGEKERALTAAQNLPFYWETCETVLVTLENEPEPNRVFGYLHQIVVGDYNMSGDVMIEFGRGMVPIIEKYGFMEKVAELREETGASRTKEGYRILPPVRLRDRHDFIPNRIAAFQYNNCLLDKEFDGYNDAINELLGVLRKIAGV